MQLRIPSSERTKLAKLVQLPSASLAALKTALSDCPPKLRTDGLVKALEGKVADVDGATLSEIIHLLVSLAWVRADTELDAKTFAHDVVTAAKDITDIGSPDGGDWDAFEAKLADLLALERSLGITAKALFIAYQFPRHFHAVRILSDARPIYSSDPSEPPSAFIVAHTLKIDFHENGKDHEWFATLDCKDLEALKDAAERALAKDKSLKLLLAKTDISVLNGEDN